MATIEIKCTSCHTRYRIDERVLPDDNPTFKCSRCGHVFTASSIPPRRTPSVKEAPATPRPQPQPAPSDSGLADVAVRAKAEQSPDESPSQAAASDPPPAPESPAVAAIQPSIFEDPVAPRTPKAPRTRNPADDLVIPSREEAGAADADNEANPLDRPFSRETAERQKTGENLSFDFRQDDDGPSLGDEPAVEASARGPTFSPNDDLEPPAADSLAGNEASERWRVGLDDEPEQSEQIERVAARRIPQPQPPPASDFRSRVAARASRVDATDDIGYAERAKLHSSGFFLFTFFLTAIAFAAASLIICGTPSASAELMRQLPVFGPEFAVSIPLENQVTLSDVKGDYARLKDGQSALVIGAVAANNSETP
ncbi:MAG TPA: zinc-ribbon domain-containing protein, partial [Candidatus Binataceae bacterium]|nr:zinc-ribbon domain-containing protein [Candidatus Binataceae bacterium]